MNRLTIYEEVIELQVREITLSYFVISGTILYGVSIHTDIGINDAPFYATIFFKNSKLEKGDISDSLEKDYPGLLSYIEEIKVKLEKMKVFL